MVFLSSLALCCKKNNLGAVGDVFNIADGSHGQFMPEN